jgi:hypothetical protein
MKIKVAKVTASIVEVETHVINQAVVPVWIPGCDICGYCRFTLWEANHRETHCHVVDLAEVGRMYFHLDCWEKMQHE